jgi:putative sigma-54 modulation protein
LRRAAGQALRLNLIPAELTTNFPSFVRIGSGKTPHSPQNARNSDFAPFCCVCGPGRIPLEWGACRTAPPQIGHRPDGSHPAAVRMLSGRQPDVQLSITARHGHLTEASQAKLRAKLEKLGRIFERLMSIELVVDLKDSQQPKVDLKVSAEHKHDFVAHEQGENLMGVLEAAVEKIEQQLRRYKERVVERHRNPDLRRQEMPAPVDVADVEEE